MFALFIDMFNRWVYFFSLWHLRWNVICTINCLNLSTFSRKFHRYVRWVYFCFSLTFVVKLWFVLSASVLIYPHCLENSTTMFGMFNRWVYFFSLWPLGSNCGLYYQLSYWNLSTFSREFHRFWPCAATVFFYPRVSRQTHMWDLTLILMYKSGEIVKKVMKTTGITNTGSPILVNHGSSEAIIWCNFLLTVC